MTERYGIEAIPFSTSDSKLWDAALPLGERIIQALKAVIAELRQYPAVFRSLKGTDMLLVPGTGILTDTGGFHSWGPYGMCKWMLMARLRRAKVLFVGVGAGPIHTAPGRFLIKRALSLATYRSYRDESSREYLAGIGFHTEGDNVYPDLAFSLPDSVLPAPGERPPGSRQVVGLGLMAYEGTYSSRNPKSNVYPTYLETLAVFAEWLLSHDYDIRLILGDGDTEAIDDFKIALAARIGTLPSERIIEPRLDSVPDVLNALATTDLAVVTRFHNVLLALMLDKPAIAISFHPKCTALMSQMKLSAYCHDIHEMEADVLIEQFRRLEQSTGRVKQTIAQGVAAARDQLDEQYDLLFGGH